MEVIMIAFEVIECQGIDDAANKIMEIFSAKYKYAVAWKYDKKWYVSPARKRLKYEPLIGIDDPIYAWITKKESDLRAVKKLLQQSRTENNSVQNDTIESALEDQEE
jgi:hypothetical protein